MKNKSQRISFTALYCALLCLLSLLPASANSAPSYWGGISASGVVTSEGDCPLVVEKEVLTFEIPEFPSNYYSSAEEFLAYDASVHAEYTFYNPTDMTVTATLLFPFGISPSYVEDYDLETGQGASPIDARKYGALVDGVAVETVVRHTFSGYPDHPDPVNNMRDLHDTYYEEGFLRRNLPVHAYTYRITGLDDQIYRSARAGAYFDHDPSKTRVMIDQTNGGEETEDGRMSMYTFVENESTFVMYVMGEDLGEIAWTLYENSAMETKIDGKIELVGRESMTFEDLALKGYDENAGILRHDYFNAAVSCLEQNRFGSGGVYLNEYRLENIERFLMRWYQYEITLEPGQRLVNTVTAPLYPNINGEYAPPTYMYEYLTSPASLWAEFGTLDIYINTPYLMVKEKKGGFNPSADAWVKTDAGYELHLGGLPEGELRFTLCEKENPGLDFSFRDFTWLLFLLFLALCALVIVALPIICVVLIVRAVVRKRRKKQNEANTT